MKKLLGSILIVSTILVSCVPARKVEELKDKYSKCETERNALSADKKELETKLNELQAEMELKKREQGILVRDTNMYGMTLRKLTKQYDKIDKLNDELLRKQIQLQEGSAKENKKLLSELRLLQEELQQKEDDLKKLEKELNTKRANLNTLSLELADRESRVKELEGIIKSKDEAVKKLRDELHNALLSYKDKGLTVQEKDGRIYVSMEAKLLFDKGSIDIDKEGKKALISLAKVLETQKDISISVEGHTDSDALSGTGRIKDNWELSVLRATSVVKIMLANSKIDAHQITPAGRGDIMPLDAADTKEAKAKNRRIEVILTPNLNKLFEIIGKG